MNKNFKQLFCKLVLVMVICCFCAPISYARIWGNWRECTTEPDCISQSSTPSLKTYIEESAGYFLNSHSYYHAFLNRVELADTDCVDYTELKITLYNAIENMEKAKAAYTNLKIASEKIPANQAMIDQLLKFDYDGFQVKHGLIEPVFAKIKTLLGKGNITGLDAAILANMDTILSKLYEVKNTMDNIQFPEISILWRINQDYAELHLFGQYVAEVFKDILF